MWYNYIGGDDMKVLKEGRPQKSWATKETCSGYGNGKGGCGAKLLVEFTDLYRTHSYHYDGSHETYITFACPLCKVETDLKEGRGARVSSVDKIPDKPKSTEGEV